MFPPENNTAKVSWEQVPVKAVKQISCNLT